MGARPSGRGTDEAKRKGSKKGKARALGGGDCTNRGSLRSRDGSLIHTGDNLTGKGEGDDESILLDLPRVPPSVVHIVFVVSSFSGQNFSQIENATARIVDSADRDREHVSYQLSGSGTHTAVVMARVSRDGGGWSCTAIGAPGNARTAEQLVPMAQQSL